MKFVSYWESAPGRTMPAYVALCLAWSKHVLGSDFLLLTAHNTPTLLGADNLSKNWRFRPLPFAGDAPVLRIVAKSDLIRMAYVLRYGGIWLDADSIVFPSLARCLPDELKDGRLHWYSEAFFGAAPGHPLLRQAVDACLAGGDQEWANPGGVRDLLLAQPTLVQRIPYGDVDPGHRPAYRFETCELMLHPSLPVRSFLTNPALKLVKLYNTYFSRLPLGRLTIAEFLRSDLLLARLFLHLCPEPDFWLACGQKIMDEVEAEF